MSFDDAHPDAISTAPPMKSDFVKVMGGAEDTRPAPWRYPARELALDLGYHLAYGLAVAGAFAALDR